MLDESAWVIPREVLENMVLSSKGRKNTEKPRKSRLKPSSEKQNKRRKFSYFMCGQDDHNRIICRNLPKK